MKNHIVLLMLAISYITLSASETNNVDQLLEQATHSKNPKEKKQIIEQLKKQLAQNNKKTQERADAIKKAKKKLPTNFYDETIQTK